MKHFRITFFFLTVALALSGCGILGGSDGTDVTVAENVDAQPTVNSVQAVPAETPVGADTGAAAQDGTAALPTAVTLPTAAPTPEATVDRSQPTTYIVKSGDVLGLIAERFDADIAELRRVNGLDGNLIRVGQELTIPALDGSTSAGTGSGTSGSTAPAPAATARPTTAAATTASCTGTGSNHCIQPGESLTGIAVKYDVTVDALRAANPGITGDLIRSGQVLNLPGGSGSPAPVATAVPGATAGPVGSTSATNDATCAANNANYPYFHASDGKCYANPIGGPTAVPTAVGGNTDQKCGAGRFLWDDGLCYPIPGVTVTPTAVTTTTGNTGSGSTEDYGRPPCRDGYVVLVATNKCWPEATNTSPATVTPGAATATSVSSTSTAGRPSSTAVVGTERTCAEPNFTKSALGTCFLLQAGLDAGCSVSGNKAYCP